jgi:hypothetical protein
MIKLTNYLHKEEEGEEGQSPLKERKGRKKTKTR